MVKYGSPKHQKSAHNLPCQKYFCSGNSNLGAFSVYKAAIKYFFVFFSTVDSA